MIVAFWEADNRECRAASNMIATAAVCAALRNERVILLETEYGTDTVCRAFESYKGSVIREPYAYYSGEGLDYLLHRSKYQLLNDRTVWDGLVRVCDRLAFVPPASRKERIVYEGELAEQFENILCVLDSVSDYVFAVCPRKNEAVTKKLLTCADVVVVNVSQQEAEMDRLFEGRLSFQEKAVYLIGEYEENHSCNYQNIHRMYRIDEERLCVIPYNAEYSSLQRRGKTMQFFLNPRYERRSLENHKFVRELSKTTDMILRKAAESSVEYEQQLL